jgi:hypothetical protein
MVPGRGNGKLKTGWHIVYDDKPLMSIRFLTLLDKQNGRLKSSAITVATRALI